jgi:hypothetical protein
MPAPPFQDRLVIAGATGPLGNEVLRLLAGTHAYRDVEVLAREPIKTGLRGVNTWCVHGDDPASWPRLDAGTAVVMFDPPRLFYERERALWTPAPEQLPPLAAWLRGCGVTTLAVVMPHMQMRLPEGLKRGLANLDEHAVARAGFDRLLIIRSARNAPAVRHRGLLNRLAHGMLAVGKYMIPSTEQPVRAVKVAQFVAAALRHAPPGIHVAAPEEVWRAAQGDVDTAAAQWLRG